MDLTTEQSAILLQQDSSFRIIAAAGSGKTTTLTLYVRDALHQGLLATSIIFITFTRLAAYDIKVKIHKLIGPSTNIFFGTFHAVMFRMMRAANISLPDPEYLYDSCMERNVEFVLSQLRTPTTALLTYLQSFRILVVDEFQDLDPHQFEFVSLLKRIQPALRIVAIGDMAQNIYSFRGTSNEFLRRLLKEEIVPELATFNLTTNFRSNAAILRAVNTVFAEEIRNEHILPMIAAKQGGDRPRYYEYSESNGRIGEYEEQVVSVLVPVIEAAKVAGKSVVLIFPVLKCISREIITALLHNRLPYVDFHRIAKEDATSSIVEIAYDPHESSAPVQWSTFHASKGLEWDIVALINVSDDVYTLRPDEIENEVFLTEKTNLLYVGMTRPMEQLLIFAKGRRHRLLARLGEGLASVMDIESWGEDNIGEKPVMVAGPVSVSDLVHRVDQHPDLKLRLIACSEHISATFHRGVPLEHDKIYKEMKIRNRERAFGTFMDRMIKMALIRMPTIQCRILEILFYMNKNANKWFHRDIAKAGIIQIMSALDQFFENVGNLSNADSVEYITAARSISSFRSKQFNMIPAVRAMYSAAEARLMAAYKKEFPDVRDDYILSHTYNLISKGHLDEIHAADASDNLYKGLPSGFDEFAATSVVPAAAIIRLAVNDRAAIFRSDITVESESIIHGEIDLMVGDEGIIEIKCGAATTSADLRGTSNCCSNLLQLLAYVAMGRHGTIPLKSVTWAMLINPLTATWERYDLTTWTCDQSREFLNCLMELQQRG